MKSYSSYMDEITGDELYKGLLAYGMFSEKLPPIFSSKSFYDYCVSLSKESFPKKLFSKKCHNFISWKFEKRMETYEREESFLFKNRIPICLIIMKSYGDLYEPCEEWLRHPCPENGIQKAAVSFLEKPGLGGGLL